MEARRKFLPGNPNNPLLRPVNNGIGVTPVVAGEAACTVRGTRDTIIDLIEVGFGTLRTCHDVRLESAKRSKAVEAVRAAIVAESRYRGKQ